MTTPEHHAPEHTAVRVALWRASHLEFDPPPHVLSDGIGLRIAAPDDDWRARPDMDRRNTAGSRALVVARARYVEDLVVDSGLTQYVILGAGLDTFAQRHPGGVRVFEVDQPGPQAWKRRRLEELGYGVPDSLRLVPVDFEAGDDWVKRLVDESFDVTRPAVVASTGVSMYLTREATLATLRAVAGLAPGTTLAMTFQLPDDMLAPADRTARRWATEGAAAAGTPFISFYTPDEFAALAHEAGMHTVRHVPNAELASRYFADRPDNLRPPTAEDLLTAKV